MEPQIFHVKPEQVGQQDVGEFLRSAIAKEFGTDFYIVNEQTLDRITSYSRTPRKIRTFLVEAKGTTHSLFFDVTEVSIVNSQGWFGKDVK